MTDLLDDARMATIAEQKDLARGNDLESPRAGHLFQLRKDAGLTQGELAQFLHVGRRTVQAWESGESMMPPIFWDWLKLMAPRVGTVTGIRDILSEREWDSSTINVVAELVMRAGFEIADVTTGRVKRIAADYSDDEVDSEGRA